MKWSPSLLFSSLSYFGIRTTLSLLKALPSYQGLRLAEGIATLFYALDRRHFRIATENLSRSTLGLPPTEYEAFIQEVYQQMFHLIWEVLSMDRCIYGSTLHNYVQFHHSEYLEEALAHSPSILFVTGHLGNWEILGSTVALCGLKLHSIARPLANPYLEGYLKKIRENYGQVIVMKKGALFEAMRLIREDQHLAFLVDQNAGSQGTFVDFLGRPASTFASPATLAYRFNRPILPAFALRRGRDFFFDIFITPPIYPQIQEEREGEVLRLTQSYTSRVEEWVRRYPTQWLWFHRRWKSQAPRPSASAPS
jgi:KDO2-lipid IV(A) lauroyltransferase